jgi:hypothetical protein
MSQRDEVVASEPQTGEPKRAAADIIGECGETVMAKARSPSLPKKGGQGAAISFKVV